MEESENEEEILKQLEKIPMKEFYLELAQSLRWVGKMQKQFAEMQSSKVFLLSLKMPKPTMKVAVLLGKKMAEEIEEEKIGPLVKALNSLPPLPDLSKPLTTTAEEKIEAGEACIAIAEKIEGILK